MLSSPCHISPSPSVYPPAKPWDAKASEWDEAAKGDVGGSCWHHLDMIAADACKWMN